MTVQTWVDGVVRWGQVNFNESDVETLDLDRWVHFWRSCHLQAVTLNAGGGIAYYPSGVELHRWAHGVERRDLFGDAVTAAKSAGLRVVARLDAGILLPEVYAQRPDWGMTAADGTPLTMARLAQAYGAPPPDAPSPDRAPLYILCRNSPYYSEFLLDVVTEVLSHYDVDGFFTNGFPSFQALPLHPLTRCHCTHCRSAWSSDNPGQALPDIARPDDPEWRSYVVWVLQRAEALQNRFAAHVTRLKPGAVFIPSTFVSTMTSLRWDRWIQEIPALATDGQGRRMSASPLPAAIWDVGQQGELLRSTARGRPMIRFSATYHAAPPEHRHVSRPPLETRLHMAEALAHGERPKWHTLGGTSHDRRWMPHVAEFQSWLAEHDEYLHNSASLSDIGIVWSPRSIHAALWSGVAGPSHADALLGWYAALLESRITAEYVHEDNLQDLDRFSALVLPAGLGLSAEARGRVAGFARAGGGLVACAGALSADDWAAPVDAANQDEILGFHWSGEQLLPAEGTDNWALHASDASGLLDGLGDTDIVAGPKWACPFVVDAAAEVGGALIPAYPFQPTAAVVLPPPQPDLPLLARLRRENGGITLAIGADLDAGFGRSLSVDHGVILANAARSAIGTRPLVVDVVGGGFIDIRAWRQRTSATVYLVNLDNRMLFGPTVRDMRPVGPFRLTLRLEQARVTGVHLLRAGTAAEWTWHDDAGLVVHVPEVTDLEVVAVDLG